MPLTFDDSDQFARAEFSIGMAMLPTLTIAGDRAEQSLAFRKEFFRWVGELVPLTKDGKSNIAEAIYVAAVRQDGTIRGAVNIASGTAQVVDLSSRDLTAQAVEGLVKAATYSVEETGVGTESVDGSSAVAPGDPTDAYWHGGREKVIDDAIRKVVQGAVTLSAPTSATQGQAKVFTLGPGVLGAGCVPKDHGWKSERCKSLYLNDEPLTVANFLDSDSSDFRDDNAYQLLTDSAGGLGYNSSIATDALKSLRACPIAAFARFHTEFASSLQGKAIQSLL